MKISEYIKKYRKDNNLSQTDLARKLFVTKQTISKWENDKGLPDIALYPTLSEMLNVSIDELMGKDVIIKEEPKKSTKKLKIIIPSVITGIIIILILACIITIQGIKNFEKNKYIKETEHYLNVNLPKVKVFVYNDFENWNTVNFSQYPQDMYYFIFQDGFFELDSSFKESLDEDITKYFPSVAKEYLYKCDCFKLIDKDTLEVNPTPNPFDDKYSRYVLYCIQKDTKRLIVINFEI